ncbi:MAG TPA: hypothetical protein VGR57_00300 [Ktedonobacterales bacterium]|nr:hypothetical protein [Ktedonobacterales bacterium]
MATISERHGTAPDAPAGDYDTGDAFGAHDIEWWVYDGVRLIPAPPEQAALLTRLHDGPSRAKRQRNRRGHALATHQPS